jgi:hypothetical protein
MSKAVISIPEDIKNARGILGPTCNNCAGFGFTYSLKGKHLACQVCRETGVSVDIVDLQRQVISLTRLVKQMFEELKRKDVLDLN